LPIARASQRSTSVTSSTSTVSATAAGRSIIVGPSGYVIHEAGGGEETMPVEIDLSGSP
jgi:predicted amidohydrolase